MSTANDKAKEPKAGVFTYRYDKPARGPMIAGFFVLLPMVVGLAVWSFVAPLNAAAIANGEVVLTHERKVVQHLEGGIVEEIMVSEGARIEKGAAILAIRDVGQRARLDTLSDQLAAARALHMRLVAERDGRETIDFAGLGDGIELPADKLATYQAVQENLFETRRTSLLTKIDLIDQRKLAAEEEIRGFTHQLKGVNEQTRLGREEVTTLRDLYQRQLATMGRMMEMERRIAELEGEAGGIEANIARLKQSIVAADIEVIDLKTEIRNVVLDELEETELRLQELTHQLRETLDEVARTLVRAPSSGRVLDLQVHTEGAVVQPGERLLDIVPEDDRLIVEARLNPNDIDLVTEGTEAKLILTAYKAKKVPKLDGEVINVTGDILTDETTGERYFLARVLVDDSVLDDLKADVSLSPGMPVQVFFIAGGRTVADYLLSPVVDATYRAFREE
ncbi:MAG: HlyD family type I secretion periplasmic adaptor subunit [Pseudomonadota bacterium]